MRELNVKEIAQVGGGMGGNARHTPVSSPCGDAVIGGLVGGAIAGIPGGLSGVAFSGLGGMAAGFIASCKIR